MAKITNVLQTANFKRAVKKLHQNQKKDLDKAVKELMADPLLGEQKKRRPSLSSRVQILRWSSS